MSQFEIFQKSIKDASPPGDISLYLLAMWYDAHGSWDKAHSKVDNLNDETACWVHAYLHRKEGDNGNADYWYRKAGRQRPDVTFGEEWEQIASELL